MRLRACLPACLVLASLPLFPTRLDAGKVARAAGSQGEFCSRGRPATPEKWNAGNGRGHVSATSPVAIGDLLYLPKMIGMVYVDGRNADVLAVSALVSISDLGPAGETWALSSPNCSDGHLHVRTLKELICLGEKPQSYSGTSPEITPPVAEGLTVVAGSTGSDVAEVVSMSLFEP